MGVLLNPIIQIVDINGLPVMGALAYFYISGGTTPAPIYEDFAITTTQPNPAESDDQGLLPVIFFDPDLAYRMKVIMPDGDLAHPLRDVDPVTTALTSITESDVTAALGYTPVNPDGAIFTSPARLVFATDPTTLDVDDIGFRGWQRNIQDEDYTIKLSDSQKFILHDSAGDAQYVVPLHADVGFPVGHEVDFININTGNVTIVRDDPSITLLRAGNATSADVILAEWGYAKLRHIDTDKWMFIVSTGVTGI